MNEMIAISPEHPILTQSNIGDQSGMWSDDDAAKMKKLIEQISAWSAKHKDTFESEKVQEAQPEVEVPIENK